VTSTPDEQTPLEAEIRDLIAKAGPMPVSQYMSLCLTHPVHGYYMTRDPFGAAGDYTTAPEISQMFGEMLGIWAIGVWRMMGEPENFRLIELGPGRGTMMHDALRAARVVPDFRRAVALHFVEVSPVLRVVQDSHVGSLDVPVAWHRTLEEIPAGPTILFANEFLDALPVQQVVKQRDGWHQRLVGIDAEGQFAFELAPDALRGLEALMPPRVRSAEIGAIYEWRSNYAMFEIGRRLAREGGAALVIDYGHLESDVGDTLQSVGAHGFADPLVAPGHVDMTAHVDFRSAALAAESMRAKIYGPIAQGEFLRRLGIEQRAAALKREATPQQAADIDAALERLTGGGRTGMGELFKVMGLSHPEFGPLPGFDV
jgi:SAM-dependent MidA family methyltransferase